MKAKSIKGKSPEEIKSALTESIADGFKPTLAIVFLSVEQDRRRITEIMNENGIQIFGATSAGEFIDGNYTKGSVSILLLEIDTSSFKIFFEDYRGKEPRNVAKRLGDKSMQEFKNPAFIISSSGLFLDGEKVIRGVEDAAGKGINIWGGKAGDDLQGKDTFVFTNNNSSNQGILLLAIDNDKISVKGQAESGWKAVGTPKAITKSEGLWIYTLDDQPALDVMIKYMGYKFQHDKDSEIVYDAKISSPVMLVREKGEPVIRSQAFINWSDKSIMLSGNFDQNDKIRFTLPPDFEVVDDVIESSKRLKESELPEADALIMFSCSGRLVELGPMLNREIDGVRNTFNTPLVGFFTYGEYGRATNGNNEYHNYTCCWVALKEI
jgi:hypothetical protein